MANKYTINKIQKRFIACAVMASILCYKLTKEANELAIKLGVKFEIIEGGVHKYEKKVKP